MGAPAKAFNELAPRSKHIYELAGKRDLSPRLIAAQRLYASGAVPTKKAAAEAVGLHPTYFYQMTSPRVDNGNIQRVRDRIDEAIEDHTIDMSKVLQLLGRKAVGTLYDLMRAEDSSDIIKMKAAQDLADRSPETSKTLKVAAATIHLSGTDAKEMAAAMVTSARAKERFAEVAEGDFVKVDVRDPERDLKLVPGGKNGDLGSSESS